jgi:hypothetical protein
MPVEMARSGRGKASLPTRLAFVHASAMVALADHDDVSHLAAVAGYRELLDSGFLLITSDLALAEAHELLIESLGEEIARSWLEECKLAVQCVTPADVAAARRGIADGITYPGATLSEALSLAMLDRLEITDVFAVDRAFLALLE